MSRKPIVLIVDDNDFDRGLLTKALSRRGGFDILEAASGDECLDTMKNQPVDLILMDIMMPGTPGTQVLKIIREKANPIELPVIMITARGDASDVIEGLQLGANDYIAKPVNFDVALSRISTHLKLAELSREMGKLQEIAALHAMVATYNHEINNPLTIAIGCIESPNWQSDPSMEKALKTALWRVADIVKKIRAVTGKEVEYDNYIQARKMIKVK